MQTVLGGKASIRVCYISRLWPAARCPTRMGVGLCRQLNARELAFQLFVKMAITFLTNGFSHAIIFPQPGW